MKESTWPIAIHYQISSFQVKPLATKKRSKITQLHSLSDLGVNWLCLCDLAHFFDDDSEARENENVCFNYSFNFNLNHREIWSPKWRLNQNF